MDERSKQARHPVLPKLRIDCRVKEINEPGKWNASPRVALEDLASGLDVRELGREELDISSIPDIWARPIMFEMALFEPPVPQHNRPGHPLNARITGEWRGLLTLLALREALGLNDLSAPKIVLPSGLPIDRATLEDFAGNGVKPLNFLEAIAKLIPSKTISRDTSWAKLHIFLFEDEPIGMTSPTTLLCTATDCYGKVRGVSWFNGRYFEDPVPHLDTDQKAAVKYWVTTLRDRLIGHDHLDTRNPSVWNSLLGALNRFITDLGTDGMGEFEMGDTTLEINEGVFLYLDRSIRSQDRRSYVKLIPSRDNASQPSILVVDDDIARQWRMAKREVKVWGMSTLEQVTPYTVADGQQNVIGGRKIPEIEIWTSKDFFTQTLTVIEQADAFPGALSAKVAGTGALTTKAGEPLTPLLPINKRLLDYLRPEDIASRVTFEQRLDSIRVRLKVRLSGPEGGGKDFETCKDYKFGESEITRIPIPPIIAVWPNFSDPTGAWKAYYVYYSLGSAAETFSAKPYSFGATSEIGIEEKDSRGEIKRYAARISAPPEAFICVANIHEDGSHTQRPLDAGIVLAMPGKALETRNRSFQLGVDFGTTGTTVFSREIESGGRPLPLEFADRLIRLTAPLGANLQALQYDFIPPGSEVPYLSLFHDFFVRVDGKIRSVLDGHIRFVNDYRGFSAAENGMAVDLKWSSGKDDRLRIQAFLEQTCVQAAAELSAMGGNVAQLTYSYPTAFSQEMQNQGFPGIWARAVAGASELTGMRFLGVRRPGQELTAGWDHPVPSGITESVAAGLYFKLDEEVKAPTAMGAVCIDIGGSTSDVAIWQKDRICSQTSLRLAGRALFLDLIERRRAFLKKFVADTGSLENPNMKRIAFYAQADAIMSKETRAIFEKLPATAGDPLVAGFRRIITLGLSGLMFYIGLTIKYLIETQVYQAAVPQILAGGNGAKLFHWLSPNGHFDQGSNTGALLKNAFMAASELAGADLFRIRISPKPKFEAAYGLVCLPSLDEIPPEGRGVLAGEDFDPCFELNGSGHWNDLITSEILHRGIAPPQKLSQMERFIAVFNDFASSPQNQMRKVDKDVKLAEVRSRLHGLLTDQTHSEEPSILVEPVFILALKALIDLEADDLPPA
ncbi:MAG TPA: hypothetical protein VJX67_23565 [Blastocatellia bacterium]|nr:hypothetical protein [Blastocatellia bacterium]